MRQETNFSCEWPQYLLLDKLVFPICEVADQQPRQQIETNTGELAGRGGRVGGGPAGLKIKRGGDTNLKIP